MLRNGSSLLRSRKDPDESTWQEIVGSKDPSVFTVFLKDSAALIGVFIAFLGIFLGHVFHNRYFDPAASILIGILPGVLPVLLRRESGALHAANFVDELPKYVTRIRDTFSHFEEKAKRLEQTREKVLPQDKGEKTPVPVKVSDCGKLFGQFFGAAT